METAIAAGPLRQVTPNRVMELFLLGHPVVLPAGGLYTEKIDR